MYWVIVPTLFLVSFAVAALLVSYGTISEEVRLRKILAPGPLQRAFEQALPTFLPLDVVAQYPQAWCGDTLQVLADRVLARPMADRAGDRNANSFYQTVNSGRMIVLLVTTEGKRCTFSSDQRPVQPALRNAVDAYMRRRNHAGDDKLVEHADGWISVARVAPRGPVGAHLVVGLSMLSPFSKLAQRGAIFWPLTIFIFVTNVAAAGVLVAVLIRRIRRANDVAAAWTLGDLTMRIGDPGRDEFSRLTHKFDTMADALSGLIETKQALAASEERNRLARDLHDTAKQRAFALNLQLTAANRILQPGTREECLVGSALMLASQLQQDLASVVRPMLDPTIAESGFRQALTDGVARLLAGSQVRWTIELDSAGEDAIAAHAEIARQLLLITVEAVSNVLRHSGGTRCDIAGRLDGRAICWTVADNGVGLPMPDGRRTGIGLESMKMRATGLPQGTFAVLPAGDGGTIIAVTFALPE